MQVLEVEQQNVRLVKTINISRALLAANENQKELKAAVKLKIPLASTVTAW